MAFHSLQRHKRIKESHEEEIDYEQDWQDGEDDEFKCESATAQVGPARLKGIKDPYASDQTSHRKIDQFIGSEGRNGVHRLHFVVRVFILTEPRAVCVLDKR